MSDKDFLLWGHSSAQYQQMFDFTAPDLNKKLLECASGFASFNAEMHREGKHIISCDPAYSLSRPNLENHFQIGLNNLRQYLEQNQQKIAWQQGQSVADVIKNNQNVLNKFMEDFSQGKQEGRYVAAALPHLPFDDNQFQLAICAYFLFYATASSEAFILAAIKEMCRVAGEVRIYPILNEKGEMPIQLPPVLLQLEQANYGIEIKQVNYEFQKGSNALLRIWQQGCEVE